MFTMFMQYAAATWAGSVSAASSGWSTSERYMLVLSMLALPPTRVIGSFVGMRAICPFWLTLALSSLSACDDWLPFTLVVSLGHKRLAAVGGSTK